MELDLKSSEGITYVIYATEHTANSWTDGIAAAEVSGDLTLVASLLDTDAPLLGVAKDDAEGLGVEAAP